MQSYANRQFSILKVNGRNRSFENGDNVGWIW
jgi:hypothetical protein